MNVHPSAHDYLDRNKPLGPTTAEAFAPEALYEIKIDVNGDAAADIAYRMRFSSSDFVAAFGHALEHTGRYIPQEAKRVAGTMLPEILPYDPTRPASFPENGRALTDDAADAFLSILTKRMLS